MAVRQYGQIIATKGGGGSADISELEQRFYLQDSDGEFILDSDGNKIMLTTDAQTSNIINNLLKGGI